MATEHQNSNDPPATFPQLEKINKETFQLSPAVLLRVQWWEEDSLQVLENNEDNLLLPELSRIIILNYYYPG